MSSVQPAMRRFASISFPLCALLSVSACGDKGGSGGSSDDQGTTGTSGITMTATNTDTATDTNNSVTQATGTEAGEASATGTASDTESVDSGGSSDSTGNDPDNPVDCGGHVYACGDGIDNDDDGMVDLMDPECTGPCDNDEASYQTGIPGDNMDCKQDCFFDGNSGQGDDGCIWDLTCDPANPGALIGCEYDEGNNCGNTPNQSDECIMFCEQYVPPGCDCFGCCTVCPDEGECVDIFLNGDIACNIDNLDACTMCTKSEDCGTPCLPEECQVCFGETEPPPGCGDPACTGDLPCADNADCPTDYFCYLDCCYPPPPG